MKYQQNGDIVGFTGKFGSFSSEYDESRFAHVLTD